MENKQRKKVVIFEVVDNRESGLPVCVGTINEVCEFTGRKAVNVRTAASHNAKRAAKRTNRGCRYSVYRVGYDYADEE